MSSRFVRHLALRRLTGQSYSFADPRLQWYVLLYVSAFAKHVVGRVQRNSFMMLYEVYGQAHMRHSVIGPDKTSNWVRCLKWVNHITSHWYNTLADLRNLCVVRLGG